MVPSNFDAIAAMHQSSMLSIKSIPATSPKTYQPTNNPPDSSNLPLLPQLSQKSDSHLSPKAPSGC